MTVAGWMRRMVRQAMDPFFTTKTTRRVGLGLPLSGGSLPDEQRGTLPAILPGKGTRR